VTVVLGAAAGVPDEFRSGFCPITEGSLYRRFLQAECKNRKVMNLMTIGPYEEPRGSWMPSVGF
jgi:hypothetical protein